MRTERNTAHTLLLAFAMATAFTATAQMPINKFVYPQRGSHSSLTAKPNKDNASAIDLTRFEKVDKQKASPCELNIEILNAYLDKLNGGWTRLDYYFIKDSAGVIALNVDTLQKEYAIWQEELKAQDTKIYPDLACGQSQFLEVLRLRMKQEKETIQSRSQAGPFQASKSTTVLRTFDEWIQKIKDVRIAYSAINRIYGAQPASKRFFPARWKAESALLYQSFGARYFQVASNISLFGWENRGSVNPELVSFFAGPFRFGFNTLITATDSTASKTQQAQLRTLSGGGGNIVGNIYLPFFHAARSGFAAFSQLSLRAATEAPILGSPFKSDTLFGNINIGMDITMSVNLPIFGGSSLYYYARPSGIFGSKPYLAALETDHHFVLLQHTIGLDINNVGRLGFLLPTASSARGLRNKTFLLSFQVVPSNIIQ